MRHYLLGLLTGLIVGIVATCSFGMESPQIFHKYAPTVVQVETRYGGGTGVMINRVGDVLTCAHLFKSTNTTIAVITYPGEMFYLAKVIKIDYQKDLALLDIQSDNIHWRHVKIKPKKVYVGQKVYSIGHPLGCTWSISNGIISGYQRYSWDAWRTQSTVVTVPGSSGSPLFDKHGCLIGLVASRLKVTLQDGFSGISFAVSIEDIVDFMTIKLKPTLKDVK